ncbi:MAG TPA: TetR/AcrR family transcriptional regulator [Chthoniobacterales bacterium]|nr:TetR/AcrR family transcriptional regulator [Chthoniobacterales bacterium]
MTARHSSRSDTKAGVLDAAERLFADHGFKSTSLRAITGDANANLGAVNYHFSSKDELILAVLRRRMQPLNAERLALLDEFEVAAGGKRLQVEKILEALFRPPVELVAKDRKSGRYFVRLMAQCLAEPGEFLRPLIQEEFAERNRRFHAAMKRALPNLSSEEVHWRLHFAHGVFLHAIANAHVLELSSGGRCRIRDVETVLKRIITFCASGCRAPLEKRKGKR